MTQTKGSDNMRPEASNGVEKDFYHDHLFTRNFIPLKLITAAYVVGLALSHSTLPGVYTWAVAAFFSVAMNLTYPWAALLTRQFVPLEVFVSSTLILLSVLGLLVHPIFVIAAIFGHGVWDLAKHQGAGVRFFRWYVSGCVIADMIYSAALLFYFFFA